MIGMTNPTTDPINTQHIMQVRHASLSLIPMVAAAVYFSHVQALLVAPFCSTPTPTLTRVSNDILTASAKDEGLKAAFVSLCWWVLQQLGAMG